VSLSPSLKDLAPDLSLSLSLSQHNTLAAAFAAIHGSFMGLSSGNESHITTNLKLWDREEN
jgi:hypothetical protein